MTDKQSWILWFRRLVATTIDLVLVPVVALLIMLVTGALEHAEDYAGGYQIVVRILLLAVSSYLLLNGWLLWKRSQTVGKALLGITIVSADSGKRVAFWKLLCIRSLFFTLLYLFVFVDVTPLIALIPLMDIIFIFGKQRRCLHDYATGTLVIPRNSPHTDQMQTH